MRSVRPHARLLLVGVAALALPLAAVTASVATASASTAGTSKSAAASTAAASTAVPRYNHIFVLMDTDHDFGSIVNNKFAPNLNKFRKEYGEASHYYTVADPDAADVMALLAGNGENVNDGIPYWDQQLKITSLLSQLTKVHKTWKEYAQGLPYAGYLGNCYPTQCIITDSLYNQTQFNPLPDLASVVDSPSQSRNIVPGTQLATDARHGRLPNFGLIIPDECADMHGGPPWCEDSSNNYHQQNDNQLVSAGDSYIGQVVKEITSGRQWKHGNNAIVLTFTEGDTSAGCCDVKPGTGHVLTIVITSHGPRHLVDATPFNHYSLLLTIQKAFGLSCLRHSCDKVLVPMAKLFGAKADAKASAGLAAAVSGARPAAAVKPKEATRSADSAAASSGWQLVSSPNTSNNDNILNGVSGSSPADVWAVGSQLPTSNATRVKTLTVHYNGTKWSDVKSANVGTEANSLYGVSALPDHTAWAVGIYTGPTGHNGLALTEHWNGHAWSAVSAPSPGSTDNMLYSVAAVSDSDVWAVGGYRGSDEVFHPLVEHWNGHHWTVASIGSLGHADGYLTSVSYSKAGGVWATGQLAMRAPDRQVVLHLVHSHWVVTSESAVRSGKAAASAYPQGIASSSAGPLVVGSDRTGHAGFKTLVEGPGSHGRLAQLSSGNPTPQDNYLESVVTVGSHAWAAGYSQVASSGNINPLFMFGTANGGWKIVSTINPGAANGGTTFVNSLFAFSSTNIWAVGTYSSAANGMGTLIMHYTGA